MYFTTPLKYLILITFMANASQQYTIDDFGAIANDSSASAAQTNSLALQRAFYNASAGVGAHPIIVPAGNEYYIFNVEVSNISRVTLQIDGTLKMSNLIANWPKEPRRAGLQISDSYAVELTGNGLIDGQGYLWWIYVWGTQKDYRPYMIHMLRCQRTEITNLRFINSPFWHLNLDDMNDLTVRNIDIFVDVSGQETIARQRGLWSVAKNIPIFPLNTDGIDPSGINVLIENITVTNYDDAVAVKPSNGGSHFSDCSQNMIIRNSRVNVGVGMTIGSVPPNPQTNCVRNITFKNIYFQSPLKAIYIKSDPGDNGFGLIENITYKNIMVNGSNWMPMWIGPQQQEQPGTKGTGCSFFYPIQPVCPTQPRITIRGVTLANVTFVKSTLLPGVILCNPANPCTGFNFTDVSSSGSFLERKDYIVQNVEGVQNNCIPKFGFSS